MNNSVSSFLVGLLSLLMTLLPVVVILRGTYLGSKIGKKISFGWILLTILLIAPSSFFSALFLFLLTPYSGEGFGGVGYVILYMTASAFAYLFLLPIVGFITHKILVKNNFK
jgi:hypothetical protein